MILAIIIILAMLLAIITIARGLRGDAIDDHPLCRKCGFDLTGKPESSTRCPECGADLSQSKSIRIGHRKRRRIPLFAGSLLLIVMIGAIAFMRSGIRWIDHAPNWWLTHEIASTDTMARTAAIREFKKRIAKPGKLSKSQGVALADRVLSLQADLNRPWVFEWGNLLEDARESGLVPDDAWRRYMLGAPQLQLAVRPTVRLGDPIVWAIQRNPSRVGRTQNMDIEWRTSRLMIGSLSVYARSDAHLVLYPDYTNSDFGNYYDLPPAVIEQLSAGTFTASIDVPFKVIDTFGKIDASKTFKLEAPITFVPADVPSVKLVRDESLAGPIIKSMKVSFAAYGRKKDTLEFTITLDNCPTGIGFHVFAVTSGHEYPAGYICSVAHPSDYPCNYNLSVPLPGFSGDKIDFILKSDPAAATRTLDILQIWDGHVEFDNVPVIAAKSWSQIWSGGG